MDISKQLHAYEVEYNVLQDELLETTGALPDDSDRLDKLEKTNVQLKKQNMELLEKLQVRKRRVAFLLHYRCLGFKEFKNVTFRRNCF